MSNQLSNNNMSASSSSKRSPILFLFMSSLLFATNDAFQMPGTPPSHTNRAGIPTSPSQLQYTYTDEVVPDVAKTVEFDAKLRNLIQPVKTATTTTPEKKESSKKGLPNLKVANSKDELKKAVLEDEDRLTVVRFYAPYCQSCKRMEPLLHNFARRNPNIQFIDVPYTQDQSNRQLIHSLGVPSFPYVHVYQPSSLGLLEEHSVNQNYFKDVARMIESYQDGGCDLPPQPNDDDGMYGSPYKSLLTENNNNKHDAAVAEETR